MSLKKMMKKIDLEQTSAVWEATPAVVAAWAFGSAQDGELGEESDIDIAVLMREKPGFDEQLELLGRLQGALNVEAIVLLILTDDTNPYLRFEAISGRPLYCRDLGRRAEFVSLTSREYEDEFAFWQRGVRQWNEIRKTKQANQEL
jgi:predicted nucleotidyltransferase